MVTPIWNNAAYGISLLSQETTYIYPPHHRRAARIPMRVSGRVVFAFLDMWSVKGSGDVLTRFAAR